MIKATVARGHGVASGASGDPRFPGGTLRMQFPIFETFGLVFKGLHPGTINLEIAPASYEIVRPKLTLTNIQWHPDCAPETFSFFDCEIEFGGAIARALIYLPHPETKPEHFQSPSVLEIIAPKIDNLSYGQTVQLEADPTQIRLHAG